MRAILAFLRAVARLSVRRGGVGTRVSSLLDPVAAAPSSLSNEVLPYDGIHYFGRVDYVRRSGYALTIAGCLLALFSASVSADDWSPTCPSLQSYQSACASNAAEMNGNSAYRNVQCVTRRINSTSVEVDLKYQQKDNNDAWVDASYVVGRVSCPVVPPANQCASHASPSGSVWDSGYSQGSTVCADSCEFVFTQQPGTITVSVPGSGIGRSLGTFSPTGNSCSSDSTPPPPASSPPQVCSGGSCYDPNSNQFCSVSSSGAQTCVSGPTDPGGGAPPQQPSGCAVNGSAASCAGDAGQPPPTPPNPPVSDPQQQQTGSGSFSGSGVGGGITITTGTYQGTTTGTGGNGGSTTPGGGTTTPGNGTGGGDGDGDGDGDCTAGKLCDDAYTEAACGASPATAGDPLLATMAVEAQRQRCQSLGIQAEIQGGNKDSGKEGGDPDVSSLIDNGDDDAPVQLNDAGWLGGRGSCPVKPVMFLDHDLMGGPGICDTAALLAAWALVAAYIVAAVIIGKSVKGS